MRGRKNTESTGVKSVADQSFLILSVMGLQSLEFIIRIGVNT